MLHRHGDGGVRRQTNLVTFNFGNQLFFYEVMMSLVRSGNIGSTRAMRADPDDYTILVIAGGLFESVRKPRVTVKEPHIDHPLTDVPRMASKTQFWRELSPCCGCY